MQKTGFGFVSFESEETVNRLVEDRFLTINGKKVSKIILNFILNFIFRLFWNTLRLIFSLSDHQKLSLLDFNKVLDSKV